MRILSLILLAGAAVLLWLQDRVMRSTTEAAYLLEMTAATLKKSGHRLIPDAEPVRMDLSPAQSVIVVQEAEGDMTRAFRLDRVKSIQVQ